MLGLARCRHGCVVLSSYISLLTTHIISIRLFSSRYARKQVLYLADLFVHLMNQGLLAGRLFDLGYFKISLISACSAMTVANFLIAECKEYWQFVLCQGVLLGVSQLTVTHKFVTHHIFVLGCCWLYIHSVHRSGFPLV